MSRIFEDPKLLEAIAENRDNLTYGWVISVHKGQDKAITALTDGVEELRRMLSDARRSTQAWLAFLDDFVSDPDVASRLIPASADQNSCAQSRIPREMIFQG